MCWDAYADKLSELGALSSRSFTPAQTGALFTFLVTYRGGLS